MRWCDLDLTLGVVTLDRNKTNDPRSWKLSPGVKEALEKFKPKDVDEEALVFPVDSPTRAAERLIDDLTAAEATTRAYLLKTTENRLRMRVHDLRGTFVTLSLANGQSENWVRQRTGHRSSIMLARYDHENSAELKLGELTPLNLAIPEFAPPPAPVSPVTEPTPAQGGGPKGGPEAEKRASKPARGTTKSSLIRLGWPLPDSNRDSIAGEGF